MRKTGQEIFQNTNGIHLQLLHFWQWSASDLLSNVLRGTLAEFIVAAALGIHKTIRQEWASYDLKTEFGTTIEVKSAAYVQSWNQSKPSKIIFRIGETLAWSAETNLYDKQKKRQSDIYIFCLLREKNKHAIDSLDLNHWTFFILKTAVLNELCAGKKSVSLGKLLELNPTTACFSELKGKIELIEEHYNKVH